MAQPRPNFQQAAEHFTEASREMQEQFQRMDNIPTIQLQDILHELRELARTVNRMDTKMENHNSNAIARIQNSFASSPQDPLAALINPTTGAAIPNFPHNSDSITRLTVHQIRDILQALGQIVPVQQGGGAGLLRQLLRTQIGLRAEPVQVRGA